ncbi:Retrovirus-related Pol polyprotein from transposon 17.6 [Xyrichtys novacula]|uniref:Retrovirus-related Pol polyprotein from transposon 17.6 n=1 Tax=Xyrichtys novacula TaxID=13765 RepID=A0AAV1EX15_XYRNO|nr:Retrovirus-related Pol polyprotein from transposon 17.6 [Xyrichtys novacula]
MTLNAMLDSGSVACSLSSHVLNLMIEKNVISPDSISPTSVVLIGCGGLTTRPVGACELKMKVFDCCFSVPTLIVEGQSDDLILGSNVIKHLIRVLKHSGDFEEKVSLSDQLPEEGRSSSWLLLRHGREVSVLTRWVLLSSNMQ